MYWEREKVKHLNQSNGHVSCINFHSFALDILLDGEQKNLNLTDGLYTVSVNSNSFQVSAIRTRKIFSHFNEDILPQSNQLVSNYRV